MKPLMSNAIGGKSLMKSVNTKCCGCNGNSNSNVSFNYDEEGNIVSITIDGQTHVYNNGESCENCITEIVADGNGNITEITINGGDTYTITQGCCPQEPQVLDNNCFEDPNNPTQEELDTCINSIDCTQLSIGTYITQGGTTTNPEYAWTIQDNGEGGCNIVRIESPNGASLFYDGDNTEDTLPECGTGYETYFNPITGNTYYCNGTDWVMSPNCCPDNTSELDTSTCTFVDVNNPTEAEILTCFENVDCTALSTGTKVWFGGTQENPDYIWEVQTDDTTCYFMEIESPSSPNITNIVDATATCGADIDIAQCIQDNYDCTTLENGTVITVNGTETDPDWVFEAVNDGNNPCTIINIESPEKNCPNNQCPDIDLSTLGITETSTDVEIRSAINQYLIDNPACGVGTRFIFNRTNFYYSYNDSEVGINSFNVDGVETTLCTGLIGNRRAIAVNGNTAFVFSTETAGFFVHEVDLNTCTVANTYSTPELGVGANYISDTEIIYTTNTLSPSDIYILDTTTGVSTLWTSLVGYGNFSDIIQLSDNTYVTVAWDSGTDNTLIGITTDSNGNYVNDYVIAIIENPPSSSDVDGLFFIDGNFYAAFGSDIYELNLDGSIEFQYSLDNSVKGISSDFQNIENLVYEIGCGCCVEKVDKSISIDEGSDYILISSPDGEFLIPTTDQNWISVCGELTGGESITLLYDISTGVYYNTNESLFGFDVVSHTVGGCGASASYDVNGNLIVTNDDGMVITQKYLISQCVRLADGTEIAATKRINDNVLFEADGTTPYTLPTGAILSDGACTDTNGFASGSGSAPANTDARINVRDGSEDMRTANDTYWYDENTNKQRVMIDTDDIIEPVIEITGKGITTCTNALEVENNSNQLSFAVDDHGNVFYDKSLVQNISVQIPERFDPILEDFDMRITNFPRYYLLTTTYTQNRVGQIVINTGIPIGFNQSAFFDFRLDLIKQPSREIYSTDINIRMFDNNVGISSLGGFWDNGSDIPNISDVVRLADDGSTFHIVFGEPTDNLHEGTSNSYYLNVENIHIRQRASGYDCVSLQSIEDSFDIYVDLASTLNIRSTQNNIKR